MFVLACTHCNPFPTSGLWPLVNIISNCSFNVHDLNYCITGVGHHHLLQ